MVDIVPRRSERRRGPAVVGLLAALAVVAHPPRLLAAPAPLPDWGAGKGDTKPTQGKKPAELPDWDASKKDPKKDPRKDPDKADGKKPSELPDWDAAKKKDPEKPADTKSPKKKPTKKKGKPEPPPEPEPEPEPEPAPVAEPEPPPAEVVPEPPPAEPEPIVGPEPEPSIVPEGPDPDVTAMRQAKGLVFTGAALTGVGLGGVGVMAAGFASNDRNRDTMIAAGAVTGLLGLTMGLAMLGQGLSDRSALRKRQSARLRASPAFAGIVIHGRF